MSRKPAKARNAPKPEGAGGLVPRLRFPEFREAGEWEERQLQDLCDVTRGGSPRPIVDYISESDGALPWLRIGDIDPAGKYVTATNEKIKPEGLNKTTLIKPGEFILSNSMSFGRPYIAKIHVCIHDGWLALRNLREGLCREFLYYGISGDQIQKSFEQAAAGTGVRNLKSESVKLIPVLIPALPEQQKIAECLSSLDDRIRLEAERLNALKDYKKGLMQQMLPAEGETVPRLRFAEFRGAGEWEAKHLEEVATFFKGKGLPKSAITPNGKYPCIHYGELFTEYPEVIRSARSRTDLNGNTFLSRSNDVLMPTSDVTPSGLAKACCIKLNRVVLGGDILVIRASKDAVEGGFLARYIRHLEPKVLQLVSGSTVFHLYATSIGKLTLRFPRKPEQEKIADCLSSLDDRIRLEAERLDALKDHKKGLMQQIFPALHDIAK